MNRKNSLLFGFVAAGLVAWGLTLQPRSNTAEVLRFVSVFVGISLLILIFVTAERK